MIVKELKDILNLAEDNKKLLLDCNDIISIIEIYEKDNICVMCTPKDVKISYVEESHTDAINISQLKEFLSLISEDCQVMIEWNKQLEEILYVYLCERTGNLIVCNCEG